MCPQFSSGFPVRTAGRIGRNSLGVELDIAYCKLAASRLLNENTWPSPHQMGREWPKAG